MIHRTQDTYALSHFRQHTGEHLERIRGGAIETITQNGEAAMVVMSPETFDMLQIVTERGKIWDDAIERIDEGKGKDARETIRAIAARLGLEL